MQSWYAGSGGARFPYRLFALSNAASLVALMAYPLAIEPVLPVERQLQWWSIGYLLVVLLAGILALGGGAAQPPPGIASPADRQEKRQSPWVWIALSGCASVLWLAVANNLVRDHPPRF